MSSMHGSGGRMLMTVGMHYRNAPWWRRMCSSVTNAGCGDCVGSGRTRVHMPKQGRRNCYHDLFALPLQIMIDRKCMCLSTKYSRHDCNFWIESLVQHCQHQQCLGGIPAGDLSKGPKINPRLRGATASAIGPSARRHTFAPSRPDTTTEPAG